MLKHSASPTQATSITAAEIEEAEEEEAAKEVVVEIRAMGEEEATKEGEEAIKEIVPGSRKEHILKISKEDTRLKGDKEATIILRKVAIITIRNKREVITITTIQIDRETHTNNIKRRDKVEGATSKTKEATKVDTKVAIKREVGEVIGAMVGMEEMEIGETVVIVVEVGEVETGILAEQVE
jgi:hypothetical protein